MTARKPKDWVEPTAPEQIVQTVGSISLAMTQGAQGRADALLAAMVDATAKAQAEGITDQAVILALKMKAHDDCLAELDAAADAAAKAQNEG